MRAWSIQATVLLLAGSWPNIASAYRPFDATDAAVARPGEAEIESGLGYLAEAHTRTLIAPQLVLNLGLFAGWEAVFEGRGAFPWRSAVASPPSRFDDTGLFLKGVVRDGSLQDGWGPSVATEVGALLPTVRGESGGGASGAIIVSQRWELVTVHLNTEALYTRDRNLGWFGGLIAEGSNRWTVRPVGELFVEGESGGNPRSASGLLGAIWRADDGFSLDLAFRAARRGEVEVYEARLGLTWGMHLWGRA